MWETQVRSPGEEDPLEKEMATHSSILAWRIPWTEERGEVHSPGGRNESVQRKEQCLQNRGMGTTCAIFIGFLKFDIQDVT